VADAVEAAWQHVDEEAADELVRCECHHLVPVAALDAVVFPFCASVRFESVLQSARGDVLDYQV
jgi:hypothetical protein